MVVESTVCRNNQRRQAEDKGMAVESTSVSEQPETPRVRSKERSFISYISSSTNSVMKKLVSLKLDSLGWQC